MLFKRWKDLCKRLTTLTYTPSRTSSYKSFKKFKSRVLSSRDHSYSLLNLTINIDAWMREGDLYKLIKINPLISLKIKGYAKCPKSLHLPALRTLHLQFFNFVATHNHCADPFPNCHVLNTLVLRCCYLIRHYQTLSNLTIAYVPADQYSLSTPNLSSFTIYDCPFFQKLLSSTCNLSFLQQVNMYGISNNGEASIFLRWLQVLANVKILDFGYAIIEKIQNVSDFSVLSHLYFDYTIIWVLEYVNRCKKSLIELQKHV